MGIEVSGLLGLVLLALVIWAIINVVGSAISSGGKVLWVLLLLFLPLIGFIIWLVAGPRSAARRA